MLLICTEKNRPLSKLEAEKIAFPPIPDGHTDSQTDGQKRLQSSFATKNIFRIDGH